MEPALSRLNKSAVGFDCILSWVRYAVRKDTPALTHAAVANLAHKMPAAATSHWVTAHSFSCASPLVPPVHSLLPRQLMSSELHCLVYPCTEEQLWAAPWLRQSLSHGVAFAVVVLSNSTSTFLPTSRHCYSTSLPSTTLGCASLFSSMVIHAAVRTACWYKPLSTNFKQAPMERILFHYRVSTMSGHKCAFVIVLHSTTLNGKSPKSFGAIQMSNFPPKS
jgi:hypothetical protein